MESSVIRASFCRYSSGVSLPNSSVPRTLISLTDEGRSIDIRDSILSLLCGGGRKDAVSERMWTRMAVVILRHPRLLASSATPGASFDFSAPLLWKRILRLAVLSDFIRHQIDFRRFVKNH